MIVWLVLIGLLAIFLVGIARQVSATRGIRRRIAAVTDFKSNFIEWCVSRGTDKARYEWLQLNVQKVQGILGLSGIVAYRPAFANYMFNQYAVLLNEIPAIRHEFTSGFYKMNSVAARDLQDQCQNVEDCLTRFVGAAGDVLKHESRRICNPLAWFTLGIGGVIAFPFVLLSETGLLSEGNKESILGSKLFAIATTIAAVSAFVATVVSIVNEWDTFIAKVTAWF
ncbi:MAG: hypothetical protein KBG84_00265 [Planctomycetes bacterium]|nr:hypothetical protein [Planctomycetota bacterium]